MKINKFHLWIFVSAICWSSLIPSASAQPFRHQNAKQTCGSHPTKKTGFSFNHRRVGPGDQAVRIIGDVNDVLAGRVTNTTIHRYWSANGLVGFGAGAVGPQLTGLGEAVMVNGFAFVRQTDNGTDNYFQTVSDNNFRSPFAMFVPRKLTPFGKASFVPSHTHHTESHNISLTDFYTKIRESTGGAPFCFHGLTKFHQMEAIAISKAPIYNEPLFGDMADGYYTQPNFRIPDAYGLVFGCAANFSHIEDSELREKLKRALYVNPLDDGSASALQVHSHALTLQPCVQHLKQITPETAIDVFHLLSNSTIVEIIARVYRMDSAADLIDITHS